jgi:hypothetical protein
VRLPRLLSFAATLASEFTDSLHHTIDDLGDGLDMLHDNPAVGPITTPINFHISGAGR